MLALAPAIEERALDCGPIALEPAFDALQDELKDFKRKVSEAGRVTFNARSGAHDDLVLAVAIAAWYGGNRNEASQEPLRI